MAQLPPFATAEAPGEMYPQDFHKIARKTDVTDKAGKEGFGQAVYLANRAANAQNMAHSKARNHASDGGTPFSLHDVDPTATFGEKEFHMQPHGKMLPDKIGTGGTFDAETYRQSMEANLALKTEIRQKTHGSAAEEGGGGGNSGSCCPFATCSKGDSLQEWQRSNYHAKDQPKLMADKVGADKTFEPTIYSRNLEANRQQQAESLLRSYVGGGDILAFHPGGMPS